MCIKHSHLSIVNSILIHFFIKEKQSLVRLLSKILCIFHFTKTAAPCVT